MTITTTAKMGRTSTTVVSFNNISFIIFRGKTIGNELLQHKLNVISLKIIECAGIIIKIELNSERSAIVSTSICSSVKAIIQAIVTDNII